jgi:rhodanese-related sulfurtransferase
MDGEIDPEDLAATLANGESPRIVDIRTPQQFRRGHIPGSENLPLGRLIQDVEAFDGDDHVVTVCPHGQASVKAARLITAYEGFEGRAESLRGGLDAWDGPITDGSEASRGQTDDDSEQTAPF